MKKLFTTLLILISTALWAVEPRPGENFKQTKEVIATDSPGKIEVVEMFWYGCIHCFNFDPYIDKWADKLPKDVGIVATTNAAHLLDLAAQRPGRFDKVLLFDKLNEQFLSLANLVEALNAGDYSLRAKGAAESSAFEIGRAHV